MRDTNPQSLSTADQSAYSFVPFSSTPVWDSGRTVSRSSSRNQSTAAASAFVARDYTRPHLGDELHFPLDMIFGLSTKKEEPKEIELKNFKNRAELAQTAHLRGDPPPHTELSIHRLVQMRQNLYGQDGSRGGGGGGSVISGMSSGSPSSSGEEGGDGGAEAGQHGLGSLLPPLWRAELRRADTLLRRYCAQGDNDLFHALQLQPFSSGIYLRGMLSSGFSTLLFLSYHPGKNDAFGIPQRSIHTMSASLGVQ